MTMPRKKKDPWDDPLIYIPFIGVIKTVADLVSGDAEDECDGKCESCEYFEEKNGGCLKDD